MRVFLDLDGVLGDFDGRCVELFGSLPRSLTFDCPERGQIKGDEALWAHVGTRDDFWSGITIKDGAFDLVEASIPHGVTILTGCPATGYDVAATHKVEWVKKNLADYFNIDIPVITCRSKDKALHMENSGDILVDDFIVNIKRWTKAGGYAVWYKEPNEGLDRLRYRLRVTS